MHSGRRTFRSRSGYFCGTRSTTRCLSDLIPNAYDMGGSSAAGGAGPYSGSGSGAGGYNTQTEAGGSGTQTDLVLYETQSAVASGVTSGVSYSAKVDRLRFNQQDAIRRGVPQIDVDQEVTEELTRWMSQISKAIDYYAMETGSPLQWSRSFMDVIRLSRDFADFLRTERKILKQKKRNAFEERLNELEMGSDSESGSDDEDD